jgi:Domain of unknown function (DUF1707)
VTTGPADEQAIPPRGLRASHVDREQAISALKAAFVHGRLASDEFDARVGQALASRTHAELAAITADIPADVPIGAAGVPVAAASVPVGTVGVQPAREPGSPALSVKSGVCVTVSAAMLAAVLWAAAWSAGSAAASAAALAVTGVVIFTLFVTGYQVRESRHHGRSARPLPPGTAR